MGWDIKVVMAAILWSWGGRCKDVCWPPCITSAAHGGEFVPAKGGYRGGWGWLVGEEMRGQNTDRSR